MKSALNYLNHDMIFLPLNCELHWYLAVVNAKEHEIQVLDSLPSRNTEHEELKLTLKGIETYLKLATDEEPTRTNSWPDYKVTTWKIRMVQGLPRQEDCSSCGLFMLKYMEYWTGSRLSMKFTQDDINQFRRELASMLVNSPLNKIINNKILNWRPYSSASSPKMAPVPDHWVGTSISDSDRDPRRTHRCRFTVKKLFFWGQSLRRNQTATTDIGETED